jgi:plasmid stabilization system protein ParE
MVEISYSAHALRDLERLVDFLLAADPAAAGGTLELILEGIELLARHPLIGRPVAIDGTRELVLSRGRSGYVVRYRFQPARDRIAILGIRHQRELGVHEPHAAYRVQPGPASVTATA